MNNDAKDRKANALIALRALMEAIVKTVHETGGGSLGGAPEGAIYSALMSTGISLEHYQRIVEVLVRDGYVERSPGHLLKPGPTRWPEELAR